MSRFALHKIKEIDGKLSFFKLTVDDVCEFDEFIKICMNEGNLDSEIITIQARMQQISDLKTIPEEKHKDITPKKEAVKEYEIKTKHLRVYMFHDKLNGRVIVSAGKKTTQKSDIKHFRFIKKEYFKQYAK